MRKFAQRFILITLALVKLSAFTAMSILLPLNEFRDESKGKKTYHLGFMGTDQSNKANKIPFIVSLKSNNSNSSSVKDFDRYYIFQDLRREEFLEKLASEPNPNLEFYIYGRGQRDWKFSKDINQEIYIENNGDKLSFTFRTRKLFNGFIPYTFIEQLKFDTIIERISQNESIIKANVNPPENGIDFWIVDQKNIRPIQWIEIHFKKPNSK